jgi:hypothetical protein
MNEHRDPDRLIHDFVLEGADRLHDRVYDTVRAEVDRTRQRVVIGPWRVPDMSKLVPLGLGAAAAVVVAFGALQQLAPARGGVAGAPSVAPPAAPSATVAPSATPAASAVAPSPSTSPFPPPLTETFTSTRNGFSISYPSGWVERPATTSWTTGIPDYGSKAGDVFYDRDRPGDLWISVASQPLDGATPDAWTADTLAADDGCTSSESITVDGAAGRIGSDNCNRAAVTTSGRGYVFWLYTSGDEPSLDTAFDRAWFEKVLATVQLEPSR